MDANGRLQCEVTEHSEECIPQQPTGRNLFRAVDARVIVFPVSNAVRMDM
jgi:hypothetical protein